MIKLIIRTSNNIVLVFDEKEEQIPEYQGYHSESIRDRIIKDAPADAIFGHTINSRGETYLVRDREKW